MENSPAAHRIDLRAESQENINAHNVALGMDLRYASAMNALELIPERRKKSTWKAKKHLVLLEANNAPDVQKS